MPGTRVLYLSTAFDKFQPIARVESFRTSLRASNSSLKVRLPRSNPLLYFADLGTSTIPGISSFGIHLQNLL